MQEASQEGAQAAQRRRWRREVWGPVGLVLFWSVVNVVCNRVLDLMNYDEIIVILLLTLGALHAQPMLIAFWGAWGPGHAMVRGPVAIGLLVLQVVLTTVDGDLLHIAWILSFTLVGCALWLIPARYLTKCSLQLASPSADSATSNRFGIRHLLLLTTFAAILATLIKATAGDHQTIAALPALRPVEIFAYYVLICAPLTGSLVLLLLPRWSWLQRLVAVGAIVAVANAGGAALVAAKLGLAFAGLFVDGIFLYGGAAAAIVFSALVLRWAGYRVRKQPPAL